MNACLIHQNKANINRVAKQQLSPFEVAVKHNNIDIVELLISSGCSPTTLPTGEDAPVLKKVGLSAGAHV